MAQDSGGIGLLAINVCGSFVMSHSTFTNNTCNVCFLSKDNMNIITRDTDLRISDSTFESATIERGYSNHLIRHLHSAGVILRLRQMKFKMRTLLSNITSIKNQTRSIAVYLEYPQNKLTIENFTSLSKQGMSIHIYSARSSSLHNRSKSEATVTIKQAHFRSRLHITNIRGNSEIQIILSNILIKDDSVHSVAQLHDTAYPLLVIKASSIVRDITIQNTMGIATFINCNLRIQGQFIYQQNHGSVVLLGLNKVAIYNATVIIRQNKAFHYAPLFVTSSGIDIQNSFIDIRNNTGPEGGGLVLANSTLIFTAGDSLVMFLYNTGQRGGAMALYQRSQLLFYGGMTIFTFVQNHARARGGAIYVQDADYVRYNYINQQHKIRRYHNSFSIGQGGQSRFYFYNNTAVQAGSAVFGGNVNDDFHFNNESINDTSVVSSTPFQVCMCTYSKPNCSIGNTTAKLLPGQSYTIEITAVGQRNGIVPSTIRAEFIGSSRGSLLQTEYVQSVGTKCTNLTYTVQFSSDTELLQLTTTDQIWREKKPFNITFYRKDCTIGFIFDTKAKKCVCSQDIINHGMECDIQTLKVNRLHSKWINATYIHLDPTVGQPGVIVHNYCPFDYCIANSQQLDLHYPDEQCNLNRAGILCGECLNNFSHVLGTSKCKQCTKPWIALIIPLIAIVGIAFVVGLMLLNLTVSVGTINGLIFYANVVRANHSVFFPYNISNSILSTFIAWLNLDLGIEMCFYNGLDAYSKTWFQLLFPLYIWFIVSIIIVVSHCSTRVSKLIGNNTVQVLATLFLLSYAKMLRIIITVFSSTELIYPDGYNRRVWLYDGNVDYLTGKHIPLFIVALLFLIIIAFPFTAILFFIQCVQKISSDKVLPWVANLLPLFDAYTGPYKIKHRYWTGLLLLVRVSLFLVFSLNIIGNPMINLLAVCVFASCLLAHLSIIGGIYKQWWLNLIETAFILNLLILSAVSLYQINTGVPVKPITYTSTIIALVMFLGIILYHILLKVISGKLQQKMSRRMTDYLYLIRNGKISGKDGPDVGKIIPESKDMVTYSVVELREPLIDTAN